MDQLLTLEAMSKMDNGRLAIGFRRMLKECQLDVEDRPSTKTKRTVTLVVTLTPVYDRDAEELDSVNVDFELKHSIPKRKPRGLNARATRQGLLFSDISMDRHDQGTLDEPDGKPEDPKKSGLQVIGGES